jgi:hypothetical protein
MDNDWQTELKLELSNALIKAECALSDIAEGEPEPGEGNELEWAINRCSKTLKDIRPVMKKHNIRTSEWPPTTQLTPPPAPNMGQPE